MHAYQEKKSRGKLSLHSWAKIGRMLSVCRPVVFSEQIWIYDGSSPMIDVCAHISPKVAHLQIWYSRPNPNAVYRSLTWTSDKYVFAVCSQFVH